MIFIWKCSERLETVCQVKLVPLQGNAVLGTNSIPVFSPVGIMPLYLQTLCHGNVQEGLKELRNALPSYIFIFYYLKATVYSYSTIEKYTSWGLQITYFFCSIDLMKSQNSHNLEIVNKCKICSYWNILILVRAFLSKQFCRWFPCWSELNFSVWTRNTFKIKNKAFLLEFFMKILFFSKNFKEISLLALPVFTPAFKIHLRILTADAHLSFLNFKVTVFLVRYFCN